MTSSLWDRYLAWTAADIVGWTGQVLEDQHLDFKLVPRADMGKDDLRNLAKAVSGFANADGGVVVWGVDARPDKADDSIDQVVATPGVENARKLLARLNELSSVTTSPALAGVGHRLIEGGGDYSDFVATFVPAGDGGPYMAMLGEAKHRYYRRIGSAFLPMDHSLVADMFGRRPRPKLVVALRPQSTGTQLNVHAIITNVGRGIARAPYLMLKADPVLRPVQTVRPAMPFHIGSPGWSTFGESMDGVIHPGLARQWVALQSTLQMPGSQPFPAVLSIDYRLGAADVAEVMGRIEMNFETSKVLSHKFLTLEEL